MTPNIQGLAAGTYSDNITFSSNGLPNRVVVVNLTPNRFTNPNSNSNPHPDPDPHAFTNTDSDAARPRRSICKRD